MYCWCHVYAKLKLIMSKITTKNTMHAFSHNIKTSSNHHTRLAKHLKRTILIIIVFIILLICVGLYLFLNSKSPVAKGSPIQQVAAVVTGTSTTIHKVNSSLGFSLEYTGSAFNVEGQVTDPSSTAKTITGESFSGKELDQQRLYSIVKFQVPITKSGQLSYDNPVLSVATNIRKDYWTNKTSLPANAKKSKLDIITDQNTATEASGGFVVTQTSDITISNTAYREVTYTKTSNAFGVKTMSKDMYYFTIQNDRPYFISITNINDANHTFVDQYQAIIKTIRFKALTDGSLSLLSGVTRLVPAAATPDLTTLPANTANIPNQLDAASIIKVIATNQPAVVRVGLSTCAKVELLLADGSVDKTLDKTCYAGIGSGSFVSSDGYIATNGHVTRVTPQEYITGYIDLASTNELFQQHLSLLFQYLVDAGIASSDQVSKLYTAYTAGDKDAQNTINALGSLVPDRQIKIVSEDYQYAIQTSNIPMRYNFDTNTYKYSDTIIPASFIAANVDLALLEQGGLGGGQTATSSSSDVSILKAKGSFPIVRLGSIDNLTSGNQLTAIGFPAFVDDGLNTTKSRTVPSVTQGFIQDIAPQSAVNSHVLLSTTVPIAQGNSGGPAFDNDGNQVGLNTYGSIGCADMKCFGDGIVRDIADYKALLSANNITLKTDSSISSQWSDGLTALVANNYQKALDDFNSVEKNYPANYLAPSFIAIAQIQIDIQTAVRNQAILHVVLIVGAVIVIIGLIIGVILVIHLSHHHHVEPPAPTGLSSTPILTTAVPMSQQTVQPPAPQSLPTNAQPESPPSSTEVPRT
jgi:S1-C subfamily serine protease/flagellar basal body-associated protein FliL